jgi:hypothetical protein
MRRLRREKGGERSWISAALSFSMTTMGPPHWGQSQSGRAGLGRVEVRSAVIRTECREAKRQKRSTPSIGEEAEVTNANESLE